MLVSLQAVTVPVLTSEACSAQPGATRPSADQVSKEHSQVLDENISLEF